MKLTPPNQSPPRPRRKRGMGVSVLSALPLTPEDTRLDSVPSRSYSSETVSHTGPQDGGGGRTGTASLPLLPRWNWLQFSSCPLDGGRHSETHASSTVCPRHPCSPWARISRVQIVNACFVHVESDAHAGIHHARGYLNRRAHTHASSCLHSVLVPAHACCAAFLSGCQIMLTVHA